MEKPFRLLWITLVILLASATIAQGQDNRTGPAADPTHERTPVTIEKAQLIAVEDGWELVVSGRLHGECAEAPVQIEARTSADEYADGYYDVRIYRDIPEGAICTRNIAPYEERIPLENAPLAQMLIRVNNRMWRVDTPEVGEGQPLEADTPFRLEPVMFSPLQVERVQLSHPDESGQVQIAVRGQFTDGCEQPVQVHELHEAGSDTVYLVIFQVVTDERCPAAETRYAEVITTSVPINQAATFLVNGVRLEHTPTYIPTPGADEPTMRVYHVIEEVQIQVLESYPMQISLHVRGHQPDGCQYPVEIEQRREGDTIYVDIYRELPLATACPAMLVIYDETIRLEGGFTDGETFIIKVNDVERRVEL